MPPTPNKSDATRSFFIFVNDTNTGKIRRIAIPGDVQIGLIDNPASLELFGRLSVSTGDFSVDQTNKGVLDVSNDDTICAISLVTVPDLGRISVFLPPTPRNGQLHFIKDVTGTAGATPIDIFAPSGALIDGQQSQSLVDNFGSMAVFWFRGAWRVLVSGVGISNIGGSPANASYITTNPEALLTDERHFSASVNISITDNGPGSSFSTDLTDTTVIPGTYSAATIAVDQKGRITSAVSNVPPNPSASYITVTSESTLPDERALSSSFGLLLTDGGPNSTIDVRVKNNEVATLTGSTFSGPIIAGGGLTGSLQLTTAGLSYLVAGANVTILSQSNGQISISSTGGGSSSGSSGGVVVPIFSMPIMADAITTNIATVAAKQSLGSIFFNPTLIAKFSGSKRYFYRATVDTIETPVSAAVDLYDINAIVAFPPAVVVGTIMSSSNLMLSQLQVELTSLLTSVTGSGLLEARLWRTSLATLATTSSITCYGARLEVEFT